MPKQNPYLIKENKTQVEEVREIDYQVPSYEEFMRNYENDKKVSESYELEVDSYRDLRVDKSYGPGSSQSSYSDDSDEARMNRYYARTTTNMATNVVSKAAGPVGSVVNGVVGAATTLVSEIGYACSSDSDTKDAWKYASEIGQGMMTGAVVGDFVDNLRLPYGLKKGWDLWQDFEAKGGKSRLMVDYHVYHNTNGESYSSYCEVCKS